MPTLDLDNHLFRRNGDWHKTQQRYQALLVDEVQHLDADSFLNTPSDVLVERAVKSFTLDLPVLDETGLVADYREVEVSRVGEHLALEAGFQRPQRLVRPFVVGTEYEFAIPFTGDASLFHVTPYRCSQSPLVAKVTADNRLVHTISGSGLHEHQLKLSVRHFIDEVNRHLGWLGEGVNPWNHMLPERARALFEQRRQKLLQDRNTVASLGFKLRERPGAARTYIAPEVRRKVVPVVPLPSSAPWRPEPALDMAQYEHIMKVISDCSLPLHRSPSAFESLGEEGLRSHLLVQLNGHYEGEASGETFNYEGKTDILIRSQGRNIFIAECKFWGGPKVLTDTIDRLLGYASWRDTKVAVIVFNRNKGFGRVLEQVRPTVEAHPNCNRFVSQPSESQFRFTFRHRDDANREMTLTVLLFDVPTP